MLFENTETLRDFTEEEMHTVIDKLKTDIDNFQKYKINHVLVTCKDNTVKDKLEILSGIDVACNYTLMALHECKTVEDAKVAFTKIRRAFYDEGIMDNIAFKTNMYVRVGMEWPSARIYSDLNQLFVKSQN